MKNVIVFALGKARYAVELRWVREVFTLGPVTPVAHAPQAVAGVVNYRGAIMPILDLAVLLGRSGGGGREPAHGGESAILLQVEEMSAALRVSSVVEVSTLRPPDRAGSSAVVDSTGRTVPLIDPPALLARARAAAHATAMAGGDWPPPEAA